MSGVVGRAGSDSKATKAAGRPADDGPPLTLREIQLAPVIWAKLSGYSWWPARVRGRKRGAVKSVLIGQRKIRSKK